MKFTEFLQELDSRLLRNGGRWRIYLALTKDQFANFLKTCGFNDDQVSELKDKIGDLREIAERVVSYSVRNNVLGSPFTSQPIVECYDELKDCFLFRTVQKEFFLQELLIKYCNFLKVTFSKRDEVFKEKGCVLPSLRRSIFGCESQLFKPGDVLPILQGFGRATYRIGHTDFPVKALKAIFIHLLSNPDIKSYCRNMSLEECKQMIDAQPCLLLAHLGGSTSNKMKFVILYLFARRDLSFMAEVLAYLRENYQVEYERLIGRLPDLLSWEGTAELYPMPLGEQIDCGSVVIDRAIQCFPDNPQLFERMFFKAVKNQKKNVAALISIARFVHWQSTSSPQHEVFASLKLNFFYYLFLACQVDFELAKTGSFFPAKGKKRRARNRQSLAQFLLAAMYAADWIPERDLYSPDVELKAMLQNLVTLKKPTLLPEFSQAAVEDYLTRFKQGLQEDPCEERDGHPYYQISKSTFLVAERMTVIVKYRKDKKNLESWERIQHCLNQWEFFGVCNRLLDTKDLSVFLTLLENAILTGSDFLKSTLSLFLKFKVNAYKMFAFEAVFKETMKRMLEEKKKKALKEQKKRTPKEKKEWTFPFVVRNRMLTYLGDFQDCQANEVRTNKTLVFLGNLRRLPDFPGCSLLVHLLSLVAVYGGMDEAITLFERDFSETLKLLNEGELYKGYGLLTQNKVFATRLPEALKTDERLKKQLVMLQGVKCDVATTTLREVLVTQLGEAEFASWFDVLIGVKAIPVAATSVTSARRNYGAGEGAGANAATAVQQGESPGEELNPEDRSLRALESQLGSRNLRSLTEEELHFLFGSALPEETGEEGAAANSQLPVEDNAGGESDDDDAASGRDPRARRRRGNLGAGVPGYSSAAAVCKSEPIRRPVSGTSFYEQRRRKAFKQQNEKENARTKQRKKLCENVESLKRTIKEKEVDLEKLKSETADKDHDREGTSDAVTNETGRTTKRKRKGKRKGCGSSRRLLIEIKHLRRSLERAQGNLRKQMEAQGYGFNDYPDRVVRALLTIEEKAYVARNEAAAYRLRLG